jgi:hypothetical protein
MTITHGTDIGPACWRCQGTIYGYSKLQGKGRWLAECSTCHAVEGPIEIDPDVKATAAYLRTEHAVRLNREA